MIRRKHSNVDRNYTIDTNVGIREIKLNIDVQLIDFTSLIIRGETKEINKNVHCHRDRSFDSVSLWRQVCRIPGSILEMY